MSSLWRIVGITGLTLAMLIESALGSRAAEPVLRAELIFPLDPHHNHAPGIAQAANGDVWVSWYRGAGERKADDVAVYGSLRKAGERNWSTPRVWADTPGFPDCNTCLWIDGQQRLWLFWPTILANTWESCLTNYAVANRLSHSEPPVWSEKGLILLKPADFSAKAIKLLDEELAARSTPLSPSEEAEVKQYREVVANKLFQRLGWQPRCKPTALRDGRWVLPLYSDTFSCSLMAITDDQGQTWHASIPLIGFGNIQPAVLERKDGSLVAYMRENGIRGKIRLANSTDRGETWSAVSSSSLPNPGAGIDAVRLQNGHWAIIYNDSIENRQSLAVSLSEDEGQSWPWTRHLEHHDQGSYHYPAIIAGNEGLMHAVYSYFVEGGKSMKHVEFNEDWVRVAP